MSTDKVCDIISGIRLGVLETWVLVSRRLETEIWFQVLVLVLMIRVSVSVLVLKVFGLETCFWLLNKLKSFQHLLCKKAS